MHRQTTTEDGDKTYTAFAELDHHVKLIHDAHLFGNVETNTSVNGPIPVAMLHLLVTINAKSHIVSRSDSQPAPNAVL